MQDITEFKTKESKVVIYKGWITAEKDWNGEHVLYLTENQEDKGFNGDDEPLAELIESDIEKYGKYLSVQYFISDGPIDESKLEEYLINVYFGVGDAVFCRAYSDLTGYLWTDEEINVGGHDLLKEIKSYKRQWGLIRIGYSNQPGDINI